MSDGQRPLGRHELSEAEKTRVREEAEARYRQEVEAELRARAIAPTPEEPQPEEAPEKPKTAAQLAGEKEAARRAALTPEQRTKEDRRNQFGCGLFGVLVLVGLVFWLQSCTQNRAATRAAEAARAATLEGQSPYYIREVCLTSVRSKLKAPSTARFEDDRLPEYAGTIWSWNSHVDAQNSFGAQIRSNFMCVVEGTTPENATVRSILVE